MENLGEFQTRIPDIRIFSLERSDVNWNIEPREKQRGIRTLFTGASM
jgi:hypothetical protein